MQHPVGYKMVDGKPQLDSIWAVVTNNTAIAAYLHVLFAAALTATLVVVGVAAFQIRRGHEVALFTRAVQDRDPDHGGRRHRLASSPATSSRTCSSSSSR